MGFEKVLKFGGAALADGSLVQRACDIVERCGGPRPIVVVSAHLGVTDLLDTVASSAAQGHLEGDRVRIRHRALLRQLGLDAELLDRHFAELFHLLQEIQQRGRLFAGERDLVLSFGERMSARIVAQALRARGVLATPVDAFDLGFVSDSTHGRARPLSASQGALREALSAVPGIPVVTGFLAKDQHGNVTTLGRNGSDLTAALIAEATGASELQLWKMVGGMMTADPALVPDARVIPRLSFREAAEFAFHGAEILHPAALVPALRADLSVRLLDAGNVDADGTLLDNQPGTEGPVGIATRRRVVLVALEREPGSSAALASALGVCSAHGVEPCAILLGSDADRLLLAYGPGLEACLAELGRGARVVERELALAALIVNDGERRSASAARALELLEDARIEVVEAALGSRRSSHSFVVRAADLEACARTLHAGLLQQHHARV